MSKKQDCARTSSLLPLYASDDLNAAEMTDCGAHFDVCAGCRQELAAYVETRALLHHAAAPPAFDTEFFASVRQATLSSIQSDTRHAHISSTKQFIRAPLTSLKIFVRDTLRASTSTPLFKTALHRHALIASLALMCCALAALLYFAVREPVAQRDSVATIENNTAPVLSNNDSTDNLFTQHESQYEPQRDATPDDIRPTHRQISKTSARRATAMSVTSSASLANKASVVSQADNNKQIATTAPVAAISRIELQTADPNVRIIWLTPPSSPSPTTSPTSTSPTNAPPDDASPAIK